MTHYQRFHTQRDFENVAVTSINRELAHSPWGAYESSAQALGADRSVSEWTRSLDGVWKFAYHTRPELVDSFWEADFSHESWADIQVPGNWEVQGFGEPIYTNTLLPWNQFTDERQNIHPHGLKDGVRGLPNPPYIPEENPTGCYYRTFAIDADWLARDVFVHFQGVETAFYLWINGKEVGYSQDSKLPAEFCITDFLQAGENTIALQVMRFAESTYLEDQDYWYLSGIFRSVALFAKPHARILDWKIEAVPDEHHNHGTLKADVTINRFNGFANYRVRLDLHAEDGALLASGTAPIKAQAEYRNYENPTANTARIHLTINGVKAWTPETPSLYTAVIVLLAPDDSEIDYESARVGFKRITVKDGVILLNGRRLIVRGVNRHEHEARHGRAVPVAHMVEEIKRMKQLGINSVRTCHYPDAPVWYDLCDEWGILVICECNVESHGVFGGPTHNPAWGVQFLERAIRMVLTHQNHPSIYSWSLGNESGVGANHAAMAGWIREHDVTRLCQYEAGMPGRSISDVRGNMYAPQESILQMIGDTTDTRPIVLVEYLYQIRNAGGGMNKFLDLLETFPRFQGGYVWDWQDKCLVAKTADGQEFWGFGGDFGESVTDWECPLFMTNNGIVLPDLTPKPAALEMKQVYCPVRFDAVPITHAWAGVPRPGSFILRNRCHDMDTSHFQARYDIREDGVVIDSGVYELPLVKPGETLEMRFDTDRTTRADAEYRVDLSVQYAQDMPFAAKGFELGCFQFLLENGAVRVESEKDSIGENPGSTRHPVTLSETSDTFEIRQGTLFLAFEKNSGTLCRCEKNGVAYLQAGPSACLTRPFSGIDAHPGWGRDRIWNPLARSFTRFELQSLTMEPLGQHGAIIDIRTRLLFESRSETVLFHTCCTLDRTGTLHFSTTFEIPATLGDLPRVGVELVLPEGFESLAYYGMGPAENYRDRKECARLGVFGSKVSDEHFAFIPPSENGGHEDTRWLELANAEGRKIRFSSPISFHFDVHHNTIEDYRSAMHDHELPKRKETWLHLDAAHAGIGSDMGWSTFLTKDMQVPAKAYGLAFSVNLD